MTPEAQRIAIAEACGFQDITFSPLMGFHQEKSDERAKECGGRWRFAIPDYLNDLNAMHEAEKALNQAQCFEYRKLLQDAVLKPVALASTDFLYGATAAQRAEAFLRTLGKWEDGK